MNVRDVERIIDRKLAPFKALVELLDSVEHLDDFAIQGTGIAGQEVRADLAGHYGVYSRAPKDGDAVVIKLGGKGASAICIGFRFRGKEVRLEVGEVMLRDDQDQLLHIKRDGIYIDGQKVNIKNGGLGQKAARKGDKVKVTIPMGTFLTAAQAGVLNAAPVDVEGTIIQGSADVVIGGASS